MTVPETSPAQGRRVYRETIKPDWPQILNGPRRLMVSGVKAEEHASEQEQLDERITYVELKHKMVFQRGQSTPFCIVCWCRALMRARASMSRNG